MEFNIKRLTAEEFGKFADLIYNESGIFLKETKLTLLSNRLRKRLQKLNMNEFSDYFSYLQRISGEEKKKEYEDLIDVVSTNETYFFRNERHFEAFSEYCLSELVKTKKDKNLRIWSAACSTGEEPYTIAICLKEKMHLFPGWNIKIIATDIAPTVLDYARIGEYSGRRIEKVPRHLLLKYFTPKREDKSTFIINEDLRSMVELSYLNFFKSPFPKNIDVIFCRNVMIYFDKIHQKRLIKDFYNVINKNGFLFIGHSETLHSISEDFTYKKVMESPVYVPCPEKI